MPPRPRIRPSLRATLLTLLAVPLAALLALAVLADAHLVRGGDDAQRTAAGATVAERGDRLAAALQTERLLGVRAVLDPAAGTDDLTAARTRTDRAVQALDAATADLDAAPGTATARAAAAARALDATTDRARTAADADGATAASAASAYDDALELTADLPTALAVDAAAAVGPAAADARRTAVLLTLAVLLLVAGTALLAVRTTTGLARRLRRLGTATAEVRDALPRLVAELQDPDADHAAARAAALTPVVVVGDDEVDRAGAALNDLTAATVDVAAEQAALRATVADTFVTVARRDQSLLSRQLAFLDQLERTEDDPDTLEDLFTLDHLATRMRRNAESLLVLAGTTSARRLRSPLPLSDVVRTAAGEIERYDRVDLVLHVDPPVVGHLALTLSHLLAELLENATTFSDPAGRVVVTTAETDRGIAVTVADTGLGMTPAELDAARERIARAASAAVVGVQRLGFLVVGRLAARLDLTVDLASEEGRGTTATLLLPAALFVPGSVVAGEPELAALDAPRPAPEELAPSAPPAPDLQDALAQSLALVQEEGAPEEPVQDGPAPQAPARRLPRRVLPRRTAAPEPVAVEPVEPAPLAVEPAEPAAAEPLETTREFTPQRAATEGAPMPRREPVASRADDPAPLALAAAQDILPRSGRRTRAPRSTPVPSRSSAEAFWTARRRPEAAEEPVPVADVPPADPGPAPLFAPAPVPDVLPVQQPADASRPRATDAADALSALAEGQVRPVSDAGPVQAAGVRPAAARQRRAPADVRSMLSGFQAGVSRARAESRDAASPDPTRTAPTAEPSDTTGGNPL